MTFLERFEKRLRRFAIPNITLYLVVLQGFAFVLMFGSRRVKQVQSGGGNRSTRVTKRIPDRL